MRLAAEPLGAVGCGAGPPWIGLVCPEHPTGRSIELGSGEFGNRVGSLGLFLFTVKCLLLSDTVLISTVELQFP